jgi:hypothetical protein
MTARIHIFTLGADGKSMTCHLCGFTTISPVHVAELWCGHCCLYLTDVADATTMACDLGVVTDEPSDRLAFLRRLVGKLRGVGRPTTSS